MRLVLVAMASVGVGFVLLWLVAGKAQAVAPSPETGAEIASRWCASCHVVTLSGAGMDRAVSFPVLSTTRTTEQIAEALKIHAAPMRGFILSAREMQDVTAYITSIKDEEAQ